MGLKITYKQREIEHRLLSLSLKEGALTANELEERIELLKQK